MPRRLFVFPILVWCSGPLAGQQPTLRPEAAVRGTLENGGTRPTRYRLLIEKKGTYHIDLCSYVFDAQLTLRDERGGLIAEDDDGLVHEQARIIVDLDPERPCWVEVAGKAGGTGPFELCCQPGRPAPWTAETKRQAQLRDAERCVEARSRVLGQHARTAEALDLLGYYLWRASRFADARPVMERALDMCVAVHGPKHLKTARACSQLGAQLRGLGDNRGAAALYRRALTIRTEALGRDHLTSAASMTDLATALRAAGESEEAEKLLVEALAIRTRELGSDSASTARTLNELALLLYSTGRFEQAERRLREVLRIRRKVFGNDHTETATALSDLANVVQRRGDHRQAGDLFAEATAIWRKVLGPRHDATATGLNNLGMNYFHRGNVAEAVRLTKQAMEIWIGLLDEGHPKVAIARNNLGLMLQADGRVIEAESMYRSAIWVWKRRVGPTHADVATLTMNLGNLLRDQGRLNEAEALYREAFEVLVGQFGRKHVRTAGALDRLASVHRHQCRYEEAERLGREALEIRRTQLRAGHQDIAKSLNNLATILDCQGRSDEAERLLDECLAIIRKLHGAQHPAVATALMNVGANAYWRGRHPEAEKAYREALRIRRALGSRTGDIATNLTNLAGALTLQNRMQEATECVREALAISEDRFGRDHPATSIYLNNLATALANQGLFADARTVSERGVAAVAAFGPSHELTIRALLTHADIQSALGDDATALHDLEAAVAGSRRQLDQLFELATEDHRFRYVERQRDCIWRLLTLACRSGDPQLLDRAYSSLLAWKGQVFRSMAWVRRRLAADLDVEGQFTLDELREAKGRLSQQLSVGRAGAPAADPESLGRLIQRCAQLESSLVGRLRGRRSQTPDLRELTARLPDDAVWVDLYVRGDWHPSKRANDRLVQVVGYDAPRVAAWIVKKRAEHVQCIDLGDAAAMADAVARYLHAIVDRTDDARVAGARLRDMLWAPLRAAVADAPLVVVSPDLFLATIPFETIPTPDGGFLIEKHGFVYVTSADSLHRQTTRASKRGAPRLLAMGGVDYERPSGKQVAEGIGTRHSSPLHRIWPALPGSTLEAFDLARTHSAAFGDRGTVTRLVGATATEQELKSSLPGKEFVHLATHGFVQPKGTVSVHDVLRDTGTQSLGPGTLGGYLPGFLTGVVCAGANCRTPQHGDDGILTAEEVAWLDLSACELVVLSACRTGLGEARSGESLISLRRAFHQAGARAVISSFWRVGDSATRELMQGLYDRLWCGKLGTLEALRATQLAMLAKNRKRHGTGLPHTWGAFVLSGDWR